MSGSLPYVDPPAVPAAAVMQTGSRSATAIRRTCDAASQSHTFSSPLLAASSSNGSRLEMDHLLYSELYNRIVSNIDYMWTEVRLLAETIDDKQEHHGYRWKV
jgi:hypothetical protein